MKTVLNILLAAALMTGVASEVTAGKQTPGPKGGKLLENNPPRAEFLVDKDHNVTITFYDDNLKIVPPLIR